MTTRKRPEEHIESTTNADRNPDPITGAPGSHPVETGVGAALGGLATGAAVGTVAGPVGTAIGAAVGAIVGGYAGKGMGEMIDPTAEDAWLRESFPTRTYAKGTDYKTFEPAYNYGRESEPQYTGKAFREVENDLKEGWGKTKHAANLTWDKAKHAVKDVFDYRTAHRYAGEAYDRHQGRPFAEVEADLATGWNERGHAKATPWEHARDSIRNAYDRTIQLREERLKAEKHPVETGDVTVRKEVVSENQTIEVPVEREEIVIERRPGSQQRTEGGMTAAGGPEEVRIPVRREEVEIGKETVVTDEVSVGKRKVKGTEQASGTVEKEKLRVEKHGDAPLDDRGRKS